MSTPEESKDSPTPATPTRMPAWVPAEASEASPGERRADDAGELDSASPEPKPEPKSDTGPELDSNPATDQASAERHALEAQLLESPPQGVHHRGRFHGQAEGAGLRRIVAGVLVVVAIGIVYAGYSAYRQAEYERLHPFSLSESDYDSPPPREMWWSAGRARLALDRKAPGIEVVHLPDREIRLADGVDQAQFFVEIVDGVTVRLQPIYGEIVERPKPPTADQP